MLSEDHVRKFREILREILHLFQVHSEVIGEVPAHGFEAALFAAFLLELQLYHSTVALIFELDEFLGVHLALLSGHDVQIRMTVVL